MISKFVRDLIQSFLESKEPMTAAHIYIYIRNIIEMKLKMNTLDIPYVPDLEYQIMNIWKIYVMLKEMI